MQSPRVLTLFYAQCRVPACDSKILPINAAQLEPRFNVLQKRLPSSLGDG